MAALDKRDLQLASLSPGIWLAGLASLVLHLLPHPGYGFHRDEFLYLAMGDHLSLFGMQFPPLIAILAWVAHALPLDLLAATRMFPAVASATLPIVTALICRELGGKRGAQVFAAIGVLVSPLFLRSGTLFQPVAFEQVWWGFAMLALAKLLAGRDPRWWVVLGAAVGLGFLTKFSAAFFGCRASRGCRRLTDAGRVSVALAMDWGRDSGRARAAERHGADRLGLAVLRAGGGTPSRSTGAF